MHTDTIYLIIGLAAFFFLAGAVVYALARMAFGKSPKSSGPRVVVWLQHGEDRGWLSDIATDGKPALSVNVWDRKIFRLSSVEDDLYRLWRKGWCVSVLSGCSLQERFDRRKSREDTLKRVEVMANTINRQEAK